MKKKMILNVISPCSIILFYTTFIQDIFSSEKGGQRALLMISCIPIRYKSVCVLNRLSQHDAEQKIKVSLV